MRTHRPRCSPRGVIGSGSSRLPALLALAALAALAPPASAQPQPAENAPRSYLGVGAAAGRPGEEFRDRMGDGYGAGFRSLRRLDGRGWLALRVEGGVLLQERRRDAIPTSQSGRLELATSDALVFAGVGPQVGLPRGRVRPYAHLFAGVHYLVTEAAYEGRTGAGESFEVVASHEDAALAYGGGAGVYVPLRKGRSPVWLDLGATCRLGGQATYLQQGLYAGPEAGPQHEPVTGRTDLLMLHLGVSLRLGR